MEGKYHVRGTGGLPENIIVGYAACQAGSHGFVEESARKPPQKIPVPAVSQPPPLSRPTAGVTRLGPCGIIFEVEAI